MRILLLAACLLAASSCWWSDPDRIEKEGGLVVRIERRGEGRVVNQGDVVMLHFVGKLAETGKQFDATPRSRPLRIELGRSPVVPGLASGIEGLPVGTKATLHVPAELGYGARGQGFVVPPNADLVMEIEILEIQD